MDYFIGVWQGDEVMIKKILKESEIEPQPLVIDIIGDNREKTKIDNAIAFNQNCALTVLKRCLKIIDKNGDMVELTPNRKQAYT